MPAATYNIAIEQGATYRFPQFRFGTLLVDGDGAPILDSDGLQQIDVGRDFTGCTFRAQIRTRQKEDAPLMVTITSEDLDGGITSDSVGNLGMIIPDELTELVTRDGWWDVKCYNPDGTEDRLVEGVVVVNLATTVDV